MKLFYSNFPKNYNNNPIYYFFKFTILTSFLSFRLIILWVFFTVIKVIINFLKTPKNTNQLSYKTFGTQ